PRSRAVTKYRLGVEPLEERCLLALLGLAPQAAKPDIASGVRTNLSYTQVGNHANPFHYDAIPVTLTLPGGTTARITNPANGTAAKTVLNLALDNAGGFAAGVSGPDLAINGKVALGGTVYNGALLTAEAQNFGFSDTITRASAEFEVRLII